MEAGKEGCPRKFLSALAEEKCDVSMGFSAFTSGDYTQIMLALGGKGKAIQERSRSIYEMRKDIPRYT